MNRLSRTLLIALCLLSQSCAHRTRTDGVSILSLAQRDYAATLTLDTTLRQTAEHRASLMSFDADGLHQYALMLEPLTAAPGDGYPVVIFGHGFHPQPKLHGVSAQTGQDWRPGDYYRGVPERYARAGFLVLAPDYRGHNKSEGDEYTRRGTLATSYYASDVLHLLAALPALKQANAQRVFFVGHSMGGEVGLKVLLATRAIRAASLWAPVAATSPEQVLQHAPVWSASGRRIDPATADAALADLASHYRSLPASASFSDVDPIGFVDQIDTPLIVHHSRGDASVPYSWSQSFAARLHQFGKTFQFFGYDSDLHLFDATDREIAAQRDLEFFAEYSTPAK